MNPVEHRGDGPRERVTLSAEQKEQGFAAVSARAKRLSSKHQGRLLAEADAAVSGYVAYSEGERCMEVGDLTKAAVLLRRAVAQGIPGAAETLAVVEQVHEQAAIIIGMHADHHLVDPSDPHVGQVLGDLSVGRPDTVRTGVRKGIPRSGL